MALLTPDIEYISKGIFSFEYLTYFISHGLLFLALCYAMLMYNQKPRYAYFIHFAIISFAVCSFIYLINICIGKTANYWYIMRAPESLSLASLMPEPPLYFFVLAFTTAFISLLLLNMHLFWAAFKQSRFFFWSVHIDQTN